MKRASLFLRVNVARLLLSAKVKRTASSLSASVASLLLSATVKYATLSLSATVKRTTLSLSISIATLALSACKVGPDYQRAALDVPQSFKESVNWQRAPAQPLSPRTDPWWRRYGDKQLSHLIARALKQNQSIVAAEAAYRVALATVTSAHAGMSPTLSVGAGASRSSVGSRLRNTTLNPSNVSNSVNVSATVNWELDLWGQIRRQLESSQASAQATDAQLAGVRLSVATSVATYYFALRQFDIDIALLKQQQKISAKLLEMTRAEFQQGTASNDSILIAQDSLSSIVANLQTAQTSREQYEHAIAILLGVPPAAFTLAPRRNYVFTVPAIPLSLPSELLQRRPDIVAAEHTAAAANAKIGVAQAAFFPSLTLGAQGSYQNNRFAQLFSLPNRIWTLGPALAASLFDAGTRDAAVQSAQAEYDQTVAQYRNTVLGAFQSVEDSLSTNKHLAESEKAYKNIYQRTKQRYASTQSQQKAGTLSEQHVLTEKLTLLLAAQNLCDTQSQQMQSSVTLIKNLGGGWQAPGGFR